MERSKKLPRRLYKYRRFNSDTLDILVSDKIYYADPRKFNDPLDTRPTLETDLSEDQLEDILRRFVERRSSATMGAAARKISYRGPKTADRIRRLSRRHADRMIEELERYVDFPGGVSNDEKGSLLAYYIRVELLRQYDKGIVSLAERASCPLMWSHYGDQHHGICIGYSIPRSASVEVFQVRYNSGRWIKASRVDAMLNGDDAARHEVDQVVLLRKAGSWKYEREWRLIGTRGLQDSPLELEEVVFGMRCEDSTKYAVMKALEDRERQVNFYEMQEVPGSFRLKKQSLDYGDETLVGFPICHQGIIDEFDDLDVTADK